MTFYGAHNFNLRHWFRQWELHLESKYEIQIVNPFYDVNREDVKAVDDGLKPRYNGDYTIVVQSDLKLVEDSHAVIACIDGSFGLGTPMEMFYARHVLSKAVFAICPPEHIDHPWLRYVTELGQSYICAEDFEEDLDAGIIEIA